MNDVILSPIPLDKLSDVIRDIIRSEIQDKERACLNEKLLSPRETCQLFNPSISRVTLINWTKQGRLKEHRLGGRVYYKYSEVIEAAKNIKRYKKGE